MTVVLEILLPDQPSPYTQPSTTECVIKLIGKRTNYRLLGSCMLKRLLSVALVKSSEESFDPDPPTAVFPFVVVKIVAYTPDAERLVGYAVLAGNDQILPADSKYAVMIYENGVQLFYEEYQINTYDEDAATGLRIIRNLQYRVLNYV